MPKAYCPVARVLCPECQYVMLDDNLRGDEFKGIVVYSCLNPTCKVYKKRFTAPTPQIDLTPEST